MFRLYCYDFKKNKSKICNGIYEWVGMFSFVIVIFVLLFSFVFREIGVDGGSMENTLNNGDRIIIQSIFYKPHKDDIVVIYDGRLRKTIVKRVIAIGGQTVNIDYTAHRVYVNGVIQDEPFIREPTAFMGISPIPLPLRVPKHCVFVMGDNRNFSIDSRSGVIGMVSTRYILGKAVIRYFPLDKAKLLN